MKKAGSRYSPEFREKMVGLARAGRAIGELAEEFGVSHVSIRSWLKKSNRIENPTSREAVLMSEQEELKALRKENKILREEREILKKAAAWFAQESGATPSKRSSS
jgi:transposase-like protein